MVPVLDPVQTGKNITDLRKRAGLTVRDLQQVVGVSAQAIYKWIAGDAVPTVDNLIVLSAVLHAPIDNILAVR